MDSNAPSPHEQERNRTALEHDIAFLKQDVEQIKSELHIQKPREKTRADIFFSKLLLAAGFSFVGWELGGITGRKMALTKYMTQKQLATEVKAAESANGLFHEIVDSSYEMRNDKAAYMMATKWRTAMGGIGATAGAFLGWLRADRVDGLVSVIDNPAESMVKLFSSKKTHERNISNANNIAAKTKDSWASQVNQRTESQSTGHGL